MSCLCVPGGSINHTLPQGLWERIEDLFEHLRKFGSCPVGVNPTIIKALPVLMDRTFRHVVRDRATVKGSEAPMGNVPGQRDTEHDLGEAYPSSAL